MNNMFSVKNQFNKWKTERSLLLLDLEILKKDSLFREDKNSQRLMIDLLERHSKDIVSLLESKVRHVEEKIEREKYKSTCIRCNKIVSTMDMHDKDICIPCFMKSDFDYKNRRNEDVIQ